MSAWGELIASMDDTVFDVLSDSAWLAGEELAGMFYAPWLAPSLGGMKTHIREPHFTVRDDVAARVREGDVLTVGRHGEFEVLDLQPDGSGLTAIILRGKGGNNAKAAAGLAGRLV